MRIEDREKLFENPAGEYRGRPFWAWNGKLTEEELLRQIDIFRQMGFSGLDVYKRQIISSEIWFAEISLHEQIIAVYMAN